MASPTFFGDGHTPRRSDAKWVILQKLLGAEIDGGGGGGTQQVYRDRAPAAPDDPALPAISYNSMTGVLSQWDTAGASWV